MDSGPATKHDVIGWFKTQGMKGVSGGNVRRKKKT